VPTEAVEVNVVATDGGSCLPAMEDAVFLSDGQRAEALGEEEGDQQD
jgi:hypothetical protein